jgi:hypothetical protein
MSCAIFLIKFVSQKQFALDAQLPGCEPLRAHFSKTGLKNWINLKFRPNFVPSAGEANQISRSANLILSRFRHIVDEVTKCFRLLIFNTNSISCAQEAHDDRRDDIELRLLVLGERNDLSIPSLPRRVNTPRTTTTVSRPGEPIRTTEKPPPPSPPTRNIVNHGRRVLIRRRVDICSLFYLRRRK